MTESTRTADAETLDLELEEWDLAWIPAEGDGSQQIEDYYEAESWQFSGCGD